MVRRQVELLRLHDEADGRRQGRAKARRQHRRGPDEPARRRLPDPDRLLRVLRAARRRQAEGDAQQSGRKRAVEVQVVQGGRAQRLHGEQGLLGPRGPVHRRAHDRLELHRGVGAAELAAERSEPGDAGDPVRARAAPEGRRADQAARGHRHVVPVLRDAHGRGSPGRCPRATGDAAARGPAGVRRPDPQRLRRGRARPAVPRREVLRRGVQARAGRRAGQVAVEGGRAGEPQRAARHLQRAGRPGRRCDALPAAGQAGRGQREGQPHRPGDVLQHHARPLAQLSVLVELLGQRDGVALAVLPQRALARRSVQRDGLEGP